MNLAHLIMIRRRPLPKRLPRQLQPDAQRLRYFTRLRKTLLADMRRLLVEIVGPELERLAAEGKAARGVETHKDAGPLGLGKLLDKVAGTLAETWTRRRFASVVQPVAQSVEQFNAAQLNATLRDVVGVDVVGGESWLAQALAAFTDENVALIRSIPATTFAEIEKNLTRMVADGERWEEMRDDMIERLGVAESRAQLIARDQVGKLYGDLNRVRQSDLGFDGYLWRGMQDNRERDEHLLREGERFEWKAPPEGGHPGEDYQCRCYAEPDIRALLIQEGLDPSTFEEGE